MSPATALAGILAYLQGLNDEIHKGEIDARWHARDIGHDDSGASNTDLYSRENHNISEDGGTRHVDNIDHKLEELRAACLRCMYHASTNGKFPGHVAAYAI